MGAGAIRWIIAVTALMAADFAQGEITVVGNPGTLTDLGDNQGIRSDSPRQGGQALAPGESAAPPRPLGDVNQQFVTPFGSPQPPNQLTPAPILPFHPNRPLMPQSPPNSGSGRFGR